MGGETGNHSKAFKIITVDLTVIVTRMNLRVQPTYLLEQRKGSITILPNVFAGPLLAHESVLEYLDFFKSRKSKTRSLKSVPAEGVYLLML